MRPLRMTKTLTSGNPAKLIFLFTIPLLIGNLFQQFYALADTIIVGRFCGVDPEAALSKTCEKFIARFRKVEETVNARGEDMSALPLDELMALWNNAKEQLR